MTQSSLSPHQISQLKTCLSLSRDVAKHTEANQEFTHLRDRVAQESPVAAEMLETLWQENLAARRSVAFWQEISNIEKELANRISANHMQLRQSYQRLIEEQ